MSAKREEEESFVLNLFCFWQCLTLVTEDKIFLGEEDAIFWLESSEIGGGFLEPVDGCFLSNGNPV